jgi:hypothetical protein
VQADYGESRRSREEPTGASRLAICRDEVVGCDDDLSCCLAGTAKPVAGPTTLARSVTTSVRSLLTDVAAGREMREAIRKNDRWIYATMLAVVVVTLVLLVRRCVHRTSAYANDETRWWPRVERQCGADVRAWCGRRPGADDMWQQNDACSLPLRSMRAYGCPHCYSLHRLADAVPRTG